MLMAPLTYTSCVPLPSEAALFTSPETPAEAVSTWVKLRLFRGISRMVEPSTTILSVTFHLQRRRERGDLDRLSCVARDHFGIGTRRLCHKDRDHRRLLCLEALRGNLNGVNLRVQQPDGVLPILSRLHGVRLCRGF